MGGGIDSFRVNEAEEEGVGYLNEQIKLALLCLSVPHHPLCLLYSFHLSWYLTHIYKCLDLNLVVVCVEGFVG